MARALSDDLRVRVVKASTDGLSARQAAARFGVGVSTAIRWIARARTGELAARPQGRRRGSSLDAHEAFVVAFIEERRDITLHEKAARLLAERTVSIRRSALSAWLRGRGWTFKTYGSPRLQGISFRLFSLRQRIRSRGRASAKMELSRVPILIKPSASNAIFLIRITARRSTVGPSFQSTHRQRWPEGRSPTAEL